MDSPFFIINSPHFGGTVSKNSNNFLSPFYTIKSKTKTKRAWPDSQALSNIFSQAADSYWRPGWNLSSFSIQKVITERVLPENIENGFKKRCLNLPGTIPIGHSMCFTISIDHGSEAQIGG